MTAVDEWGNGDENGGDYSRIPPRLIAYRLRTLERKVESLEKKIDRLTMTIVTGLITLTVAIIVYTVSSGSGTG